MDEVSYGIFIHFLAKFDLVSYRSTKTLYMKMQSKFLKSLHNIKMRASCNTIGSVTSYEKLIYVRIHKTSTRIKQFTPIAVCYPY